MAEHGVEPKYLSYLFAKAGRNGVPFSGTFELTSRCNLNCKMCYIHSSENNANAQKRELDADKWKMIADSAAELGCTTVLLTGGEPFICDSFFEVYDYLKSIGMLISVNSNLTLLDDEMIKRLSENPPTAINVSLYGASAETYEAVCGNGAAYEKVIGNISKLREKNIRVKLNFTMTEQNICDTEAVFEFAHRSKLNLQTASYLFPPLRACETGGSSAVRPSADAAGRNAALAMLMKCGNDNFPNEVKKLIANGENSDFFSSCIERVGRDVICRAGRSTFWVTCDGRLTPCGMMTEPSVSLINTPFSAAWEKIKEETAKIRLPAECNSCTKRFACDVCAASCFAEGGSFSRVPVYQCEKAETFLKEIKIMAEGCAED